ncbi:MAG: ribonucleoside-diphosphate reductase, adenosylcobalamin-dependent, partial [candidate division Zixibacteria bacterium]|nr:ribonucleoside-diphosphate reductase, adenosylcobalamin-dependent [candidate division Zixibacteria bacterium]
MVETTTKLRLKNTAMVFKAGGGMGYNFSKLRPEGDFVSTTSGVASGPLSFMKLFDTMTDVIKQGGIRRGANMGVLDINHPDIEKFIKSKEGNQSLTNFNISVLITPEFWKYYQKNEPFPLINPRNGKVVKKVN